jgi:hypothetical protein
VTVDDRRRHVDEHAVVNPRVLAQELMTDPRFVVGVPVRE